MANIHETIAEVEKFSPELAKQIQKYVKDHSYGLVYEQNLPDVVRLWNKKPVKGDNVHILPPRGEFDKEENFVIWKVQSIVDGNVTLIHGKDIKIVSSEGIVPVVGHRDVIYPGLKIIDKVERGGKDDPYHVLINAENYHALEMLRYAYAGKVDCIYIDPPYNTGNKDWKYNNNYVSEDDKYCHSKWLTMMERRLRLAKDLLNPKDSVMIITIDEKEYLRLGMLLEQTFPEANIQMISSIVNTKGSARQNSFFRTNEFIYFVMIGESKVLRLPLSEDYLFSHNNSTSMNKVVWQSFVRDKRSKRPNLFYPIYIDISTDTIKKFGKCLPLNVDKNSVSEISGCITVFPLFSDGEEAGWRYSSEGAEKLYKLGYLRVKKSGNKYVLSYLPTGTQKKIENGEIQVLGTNNDGSLVIEEQLDKCEFIPGTQWKVKSHDATIYGTGLLKLLIPDHKFPYPKSLYAVEDCVRFFVANKPNALIVDFFAGSGTTAHATMIFNHLDGGHRRCISVTNNEIGPDNEKVLIEQGFRPTDKEWQDKGIANYITWPRIKAAITGIATNGELIKGNYKFTEEFPMCDGFKENAIFCELTYESPWDIRLDRAFNAVALILWMLAGCKGKVIKKLSDAYAMTDNYAVLFKYDAVNKFAEMVKSKPFIEHIFVVTDDQQRYLEVLKKINWINPKNVHRLYESYLKSFEILGEGGLD